MRDSLCPRLRARAKQRMEWPMRSLEIFSRLAACTAVAALLAGVYSGIVSAQEPLPWQGRSAANDAYRAPEQRNTYGQDSVYRPVQSGPGEADSSAGGASPDANGVYRPRGGSDAYSPPPSSRDSYREDRAPRDSGYDAPRSSGQRSGGDQYGEPYAPPRGGEYRDEYRDGGPRRGNTYTEGEIMRAGHGFFGSVSQGLASAVEYVFRRLDAPMATFSARMPAARLSPDCATARAPLHQGCRRITRSTGRARRVGYDFGAEGSKIMVLVYNLRDPSEIYNRFGGVQGSAYLVGGVGVQFQKHGDVTIGAHPLGCWPSAGCQRRIFEVYAEADLEPVLRVGIAPCPRFCLLRRASASSRCMACSRPRRVADAVASQGRAGDHHPLGHAGVVRASWWRRWLRFWSRPPTAARGAA